MTETTPSAAASVPLLELRQVEAVYSRVILALRGISLLVQPGEVVALLGANGAGKSTTLKAVSNVLRAGGGEVTRGRILYGGREISGQSPSALVEQGLVQVLEGRHCFQNLSIEENLIMGALTRSPTRQELRRELERIYGLFPGLRDRRHSRAGYTSGGEQQMAAIGRALMARPKLILLDEPSMGLAPQIVEDIFEIVRTINRDEGVSVLMAEQNAVVALEYAGKGYIMENGRIVGEGTAGELLARNDVRSFYLGKSDEKSDQSAEGPPIAGRDRARRPEFAL